MKNTLIFITALVALMLTSCSIPGSTYSKALGSAVNEHVQSNNSPAAMMATQATQNNFWGGAR